MEDRWVEPLDADPCQPIGRKIRFSRRLVEAWTPVDEHVLAWLQRMLVDGFIASAEPAFCAP